MDTIALSLISHTNVGKTTLARTLLRRDVGEVLDRAHVTDVSEAHPLVETAAARLVLWDTPGLGDSARLVRRLRQEGNALGWLLHQVWDRSRDRPLYSSQEAVRNIQSQADVVLYLVNATEDPAHAGYVAWELELLDWLAKPVLVLLNQTGDAAPAGAAQAWEDTVRDRPIVRGVLALDAFTRCWVQEGVLLDRVAEILPEARRPAMRALAAAWREQSLAVFRESCARIAGYLAAAATDGEPLSGEASRAAKRRAMRALADRLDHATRELVDALIALHGLRGRHRAEARARLAEDFRMPGEEAWSSGAAAVFGAAMGGAAGGLAADVLSGGLTFGGGAVAGALLGAAGAAGLRKGFELARSGSLPPRVEWSDDFLRELAEQALLRYLALAHFGRGRGEWDDPGGGPDGPARTALAAVLARRRGDPLPDDRQRLEADVAGILCEVLSTAYPQAVGIFSGAAAAR